MEKLVASMAGNVWKIVKHEGDSVGAGEDVVILESMKMEIPVEVEASGTVQSVVVGEGDFVQEGDTIVRIAQ